ncbi:MAG: ABC transporter [Candidatus Cloacimonas sp. 4484_143]|nr:MAG: ABC transporter [Candidatus Cloacimonas sp. 4484_143]RLC53136.1 MAG: ABC transporter [Candidatus Cloacimonadota bacterium]RLC53505.1 MAG: ABC transporter [Candidatus Cloacimonadota bacterium]
MAILEVKNISKSFASLKAVDDVSFSIEEGDVLGLLGPNGAGKTTTIRMIMNIIVPDSGSVTLLKNSEENSTNLIGYLPEERGIYRKMKLVDVLLFLAKLKEMKMHDAKEQIDYWLERLDLIKWKKKKIEELSKGMQQKLQFIATILHKPKLLILDEPFLGLDPINTNLIKEIILELKAGGTTIIFSTHQMESAEKLCNKIILINKGKVILSGKIGEVKESFGKRNIHLEYEGKEDFLNKNKMIKKFDNFGNYVEIQLEENVSPQDFLKEIISKIQIKKFEIKEPSLNDIFIESVHSQNQEDDHE